MGNVIMKSASFLLALIMCALVVVGCKKDNELPDQSNEVSDVVSETSKQPLDVIIAENGKTEFTIYIDDQYYSDKDFKQMVTDIRNLIKSKTSANIEIFGGTSVKAENKDKPAILVGNTGFAESKSRETVSRAHDFYVDCVGNKIVLYGETIEGCKNAMAYFYSILADQSASDMTLHFTEEHIVTSNSTDAYSIESIICAGSELKEYRIVVPKSMDVNEKYFAYNLRYHLYSKYGYTVNIVKDGSAPQDKEILIGKTSRQTVSVDEKCFSISVSQGKMLFYATDMQGYNAMLDHVLNNMLSGNQRKYSFENGFNYSAHASESLNDGTKFITQSNGDARVMFWNVLGLYAESGSPQVRQPLQKEVVSAYAPSVLALQEMSSPYHSGFTPMLRELGYTKVETDTKNTAVILFYKASETELLKSGYRAFSKGPLSGSGYGAAWGVFKDTEGNTFAVISTHFFWSGDKPVNDVKATREANAVEISEVVTDILAEYPDIPVLVGGDLNSRISSEPAPHNILKEIGLRYAWDIAEEKNDIETHPGAGIYDTQKETYTSWQQKYDGYSDAIDHVYVTSQAKIDTFCVLDTLYCKWASDHRPILVEFSF